MPTEEYLQLIREGDYTQIPEWIERLVKQYSPHDNGMGADQLIPLLSYELINYGFSSDDLRHVEILYAILNNPLIMFESKTEYSMNLFISAALQYQVYKEHDLLQEYQKPGYTSIKDVKQLLFTENTVLNEKQLDQEIRKHYQLLDKRIPSHQQDVNQVRDNILSVLSYQNRCRAYLNALEHVTEGDRLWAMRKGVMSALDEYLSMHVILTSRLSIKIEGFLTKVRALSPCSWEEPYLDSFYPKSLFQWVYEGIASKGVRFFSAQILKQILPAVEEDDRKEMKEAKQDNASTLQ